MTLEACGHRNDFQIDLLLLDMSKAFVAIHCETGKENPVIRSLMEIRGVSEVTGVLGLYDVVIKVEASSSSALEEIITKYVRKVPHVLTTMTLIVI